MRQQTRRDWSTLSLPERQKQFRTTAAFFAALLTLHLGLVVYVAHRYVVLFQTARQYHASQADAHDVRFAVVSQYQYSHSKRPNDYLLELKSADGTVRYTNVVSHALWSQTAVGDTVTAQVWHGRICRVQAHEITSLTHVNPDYRARQARPFTLLLGATWLVYALASLWSLRNIKRRMMQAPAPSAERIL